MKTYKLQIMTLESYRNYMTGNYNYNIIEEYYDGNTKMSAIAKARRDYPEEKYYITNYVVEVTEK